MARSVNRLLLNLWRIDYRYVDAVALDAEPDLPEVAAVIILHSPLGVNECIRRLKHKADSPFNLFGNKPIIGGVSGTRFFARKRLPLFFHNSFQPRLTARLEEEAGGAVVYCSFALSPFVIGFLIFWVGFMGGSVAIASLSELSRPSPSEGAWMGVFAPVFMLVFMGVLTGASWWFSSNDKDFLIGIVSRTIEVKPDCIQLES